MSRKRTQSVRASRKSKKAQMRLTAAVTIQGNWHVAQCLEVDIANQGKTLEESLANLREALELYFEDSHAAPTSAPIIAPVEVSIGQ